MDTAKGTTDHPTRHLNGYGRLGVAATNGCSRGPQGRAERKRTVTASAQSWPLRVEFGCGWSLDPSALRLEGWLGWEGWSFGDEDQAISVNRSMPVSAYKCLGSWARPGGSRLHPRGG